MANDGCTAIRKHTEKLVKQHLAVVGITDKKRKALEPCVKKMEGANYKQKALKEFKTLCPKMPEGMKSCVLQATNIAELQRCGDVQGFGSRIRRRRGRR